jgi:uncharacterized membrane protein
MKYILSVFFVIFVVTLVFASNVDNSIGKRVADKLIDIGINPYFAVLLIATLPIVELRGSIPVGFLLELNWIYIVLVSIIGNMLPIFFILYFLGIVEKFLRRFKIFDMFFNWLFKRTKAKSILMEKYEELGLMLFVAIPAPITGAWTGSLASYIMKLSYLKSLFFIFLGVLIAAGIVTAFSFFVVIESISLLWKIVIISVLVLLIVIIYLIINKVSKKK